MFHNLAKQQFYLLVPVCQFMQSIIRNPVKTAVLQRFYNQPRRFLLQKTLYTDHNTPFIRKMFRHVTPSLIIILPHHSAFHKIHVPAYIPFGQHHITLRVFKRYEYVRQRFYTRWRQTAVNTGYLTCHIAS